MVGHKERAHARGIDASRRVCNWRRASSEIASCHTVCPLPLHAGFKHRRRERVYKEHQHSQQPHHRNSLIQHLIDLHSISFQMANNCGCGTTCKYVHRLRRAPIIDAHVCQSSCGPSAGSASGCTCESGTCQCANCPNKTQSSTASVSE